MEKRRTGVVGIKVRRRLGVVAFTKSTLKRSVKFLLQNCYFKLRNMMFREIIGTSMNRFLVI